MNTESLPAPQAIKAPKPLIDSDEVQKAIRFLVEENSVFELRLLGASMYNASDPRTFSGFFDNVDSAVTSLSGIRAAKGIYVTLNPVVPDLQAIRGNHLDVAKSGETTSDTQIVKRRWLLIDCDPKRVSPLISASDAELNAAAVRAQEVETYLTEHGFPEPVRAESGNGAHLLYRVELPTNDQDIIKDILNALAQKFDDDAVEIDKTVFNASRIVKLYGTLACKGVDTPERPHRMSHITHVPAAVKVVDQIILEMFAAEYTPAPATTSAPVKSNQYRGSGQNTFDVRGFIQKHSIEIKRENRKHKMQVIELKACPFNPDHGEHGEVAVFIHDDGKLGFKCHHNSCSDKTWSEFRQYYEPECYTRGAQAGQNATVGMPSTDVCKAIMEILTDGKLSPTDAKTKAANVVVVMLTQRGRFYYDTRYRDCSTAMYFNAVSKKLMRIQSDEFLCWLSDWTAVNAANNLFEYIKSAVATESVAGKSTTGIIPEGYWASRDGAVYMSNGDGQVVKMMAGKVDLVDNGTDGVLFPVGRTLPKWHLVEPEDPFESCDLFAKGNYINPEGKMLFKLWALSLPMNPGCKPPLVTSGPIRSGKTRISKGLLELYGLTGEPAEVSATDKSKEDFWVNLNAGGVHILDNCDTKVGWLPDSVAAAATGGGSARRKLYSDSTTIELKANAWLILTSMNPTFAADVGLADRLLVVRMHQRDMTSGTSDAALSLQIADKRDAGLSYIVQMIAAALADQKPVTAGLNLRHPDFATFAVKLGRAMNCEAEVVAALQSAETDKSRFCLENDPLGKALLNLIPTMPFGFNGTAKHLLSELAAFDTEFGQENKGIKGTPMWSAKRVGMKLENLWQYIDTVFAAKKQEDAHSKTMMYSISDTTVAVNAGSTCGTPAKNAVK